MTMGAGPPAPPCAAQIDALTTTRAVTNRLRAARMTKPPGFGARVHVELCRSVAGFWFATRRLHGSAASRWQRTHRLDFRRAGVATRITGVEGRKLAKILR